MSSITLVVSHERIQKVSNLSADHALAARKSPATGGFA
jgi:hypothetical protein